MATGLYPQQGLQLYLASSNPQEPVWLGMREADPVIPDGESSLGIPLNAGITTSVSVTFDSAPTVTGFDVMLASNPTFDDEFILDSVAASGTQTYFVWSTADMVEIDGFLRITNQGTADITSVRVQQRAAFWG